MQRNTLPQVGIAALVGAFIVAGLFTIGGPQTGRMEKRDDLRQKDLRTLRQQVTCIADRQGKVLPETITDTPGCTRSKPLADPVTEAPYVYEKLGPKSFRLCASFELPELLLSNFKPGNPTSLSCDTKSYSKGQ